MQYRIVEGSGREYIWQNALLQHLAISIFGGCSLNYDVIIGLIVQMDASTAL